MNNQKLLLICILILLTILSKPAFSRRVLCVNKTCHSNARLIQSAIEMYNIDHSKMIEYYDSNTEDILLKNKYIKNKIKKPEPYKCEYKSIGNLTKNGFIICTYHGDPDNLVYSEYYDERGEKYEKLPQNATDEEIESKIKYIKEEKEKYLEELRTKKDLEKKGLSSEAFLFYYTVLFGIPAIILFLLFKIILFEKELRNRKKPIP